MIKYIKKTLKRITIKSKLLDTLKKLYELSNKFINPIGFEDSDTLYAFYDGRSSMDYGKEFERLAWISYDIVPFLFLAEIARRKKKLKKIYVIIYFNNKAFFYKKEHWRYYNIVIQNLSILPSISGFCSCSSTKQLKRKWKKNWKNIYPYNYSYYFPKEGYKLRNSDFNSNTPLLDVLSVNDEALRLIDEWVNKNVGNKKLVTVTLRECNEYSKRNSDINSWIKFAKELNPDEYYVVFLRDSDKAFNNSIEAFTGMNVFNVPLYNIQLRLALYKTAFLNMGINNGCCVYFLLCNINSLFFVKLINNIDEYAYVSENNWKEMELVPGKSERFNFNTENVKLIWAHDSYDIIKKEFDMMIKKLTKI